MMPPRPVEVAKDQGYYDHALLDQDREVEQGALGRRARSAWRLFWLVAGVVAGAVLVGLFLWILIGFH